MGEGNERDPAQGSAEPVAWRWTLYPEAVMWTFGAYAPSNAVRKQPLYAAPPAPHAALRHAFRAADKQDWDHLFRFIPDSGHGRFWKAVFGEVLAALQPEAPAPVLSGQRGGDDLRAERDLLKAQVESARASAIEECAKVAELNHALMFTKFENREAARRVCVVVAKSIRALSSTKGT